MRQKCIYILAELIYECERKIVAILPFATISERIVTTSKMSLPTAYIQHSNETVYSFPFGTSAAFIFYRLWKVFCFEPTQLYNLLL